jgi:hypothetical protein
MSNDDVMRHKIFLSKLANAGIKNTMNVLVHAVQSKMITDERSLMLAMASQFVVLTSQKDWTDTHGKLVEIKIPEDAQRALKLNYEILKNKGGGLSTEINSLADFECHVLTNIIMDGITFLSMELKNIYAQILNDEQAGRQAIAERDAIGASIH